MAITRLYRPRDRAALRELVLALHETIRPLQPDLPPGREIIDGYFAALLARVEQTRGAIFVAEEDARLIGHAILYGLVEPSDADERREKYTYLAELFVRPRHRGRGIGRELVERAESYARRLGAYKLELAVTSKNETGAAFYRNLGYETRVLIMSKRM